MKLKIDFLFTFETVYTHKKILFVIGIVYLFLLPVAGYSKGITIKQDSITIEQAFDLIEFQSPYTIAYNRSQIDLTKKISLFIENSTLEAALVLILDDTGWTFYIKENHIIITKQKETNKQITQHIRGRVYDKLTLSPLPSASVILLNDPNNMTFTDEEGIFEFKDLLPGRYGIKASHIGYTSFIYTEIILISAHTPFIEMPLTENVFQINEVLISSFTQKEQTSNPMVLVGGRLFSAEECSRFAGGFDDPARVVTSFAGVSGGVGDNSVVIHGYAPHLLQWKLEGIEIANPNHFADLTTTGGGIFSSLSTHVLGNSDFLTGAYPAEYNNAFSGVFDMKLRTGNKQSYQSNVEASLTGLSIASEGPFTKKKRASYLFNYRTATFGLIKKFIPDMEINNFGYQDISFKINFPYKEKNSFSVWGLALMDKNYEKFEKYPAEWSPEIYKISISGNQHMASGGLVHNHAFNNKTSLKTSVGIVYTNNDLQADSLESLTLPQLNLHNNSYQMSANLQVTHKTTPIHTNKSGITWTSMFYNFFYNQLEQDFSLLNQSKLSGHTGTLSAFSNSLFNLHKQIKLNVGINSQVFLLNNKYTIEPRFAVDYSLHPSHSLAFGYGLHSRLERLTTYFIETENGLSNKNLDFIKSHQFVLSYQWKIADKKIFKVEPYLHYLFNIPMVFGTPYSTLNGLSFIIDVPLANEGKGINKGIDVTFERYLSNGYYYLLTGSLYDSRYKGKNTPWFNTKYNYRFITNIVAGKEWTFGYQNQHIVSSNIKFILRGGERYTPVNQEASYENSRLVSDENQMYKNQFAPKARIDLTLNYKLNKKYTTQEISFKVLNLTGSKEYYRHRFDPQSQLVVKDNIKIILPNISYKIYF